MSTAEEVCFVYLVALAFAANEEDKEKKGRMAPVVTYVRKADIDCLACNVLLENKVRAEFVVLLKNSTVIIDCVFFVYILLIRHIPLM